MFLNGRERAEAESSAADAVRLSAADLAAIEQAVPKGERYLAKRWRISTARSSPDRQSFRRAAPDQYGARKRNRSVA